MRSTAIGNGAARGRPSSLRSRAQPARHWCNKAFAWQSVSQMLPAEDSPYLTDASGYRGTAEQIFLPESEAEVVQIIRDANAQHKSLTLSGAGTGLTGGRVPHSGWLVCLEKLRGIAICEG